MLTRSTLCLPLNCGAYDHQTVVAPDITLNNPVAIAAKDCRHTWASNGHFWTLMVGGKAKKCVCYYIRFDRMHGGIPPPSPPLPMCDCREYHQRKEYHIKTMAKTDKELIFEYNIQLKSNLHVIMHGQTLYTGNSKIKCTGVNWWSNAKNKTMGNILEWFNNENQNCVTVAGRRLRLPFNCHAQKGECVMRVGTWLWPTLGGIAECKFFKIQDVSGKEITSSEGTEVKTVFIDDQRLVRLEVKEPVYYCLEEMYTTNYPLLFLIPAAQKSALSDRAIDPDDVDLNLNFDQQDNWIYCYTGHSIEDFAAKTFEMLCLGERQLYANKYAVLAAAQQAVLAYKRHI